MYFLIIPTYVFAYIRYSGTARGYPRSHLLFAGCGEVTAPSVVRGTLMNVLMTTHRIDSIVLTTRTRHCTCLIAWSRLIWNKPVFNNFDNRLREWIARAVVLLKIKTTRGEWIKLYYNMTVRRGSICKATFYTRCGVLSFVPAQLMWKQFVRKSNSACSCSIFR